METNYALLANEEPTDEKLIDYENLTYTIQFTALKKRWEISHTPENVYRSSPWARQVKDWGTLGNEIGSLNEVKEYKNVEDMSIDELTSEQKSLENEEKIIQDRLKIVRRALVVMLILADVLMGREKEWIEEDIKKKEKKEKKRKVEIL